MKNYYGSLVVIEWLIIICLNGHMVTYIVELGIKSIWNLTSADTVCSRSLLLHCFLMWYNVMAKLSVSFGWHSAKTLGSVQRSLEWVCHVSLYKHGLSYCWYTTEHQMDLLSTEYLHYGVSCCFIFSILPQNFAFSGTRV